MASAIAPDFPPSAADLPGIIARLGGIPPERVRLRPAPGTATEAHLIRAVERKRGRLCELVDRTLVDKAMGFEVASLGFWIGTRLNIYVRGLRLGVVSGADSLMRLSPELIRLPDIVFITAKKWRRWCRTRPAVADFGLTYGHEI